MDAKIERLLKEYEERSAAEWALARTWQREEIMRRRDELLLEVGPATGTFLSILVKEAKARNLLELGTSYGYSTTWRAEAAREIGGRVTTLELSSDKSAFAKRKLAGVDLDSFVDFHVGNALEILPTLKGPFDLVLMDLWKDLYVPCFDLVLPRLVSGAIVVADNMLFPPEVRVEADAYRRRVRESGQFESVLLPIGSGIEVSRRMSG